MRRAAYLLLLITLLLSACAKATQPVGVDYQCKTDADCSIKDIGSCCGYYPACVNNDSPTFPKQVKAQCEAEGRMSVCGFPSISGCQCIKGKCAGTGSDQTDPPLLQ